jgi:hypothetical protein
VLGRTDVIHAVTKRLENHAPASNQEVSEIIRAEIEKLGVAQNDPAPERTCWLASYATSTEGQLQTMLALSNRDDNYAFDHFRHNRVIGIRPAGMSEDIGRQFMIECASAARPAHGEGGSRAARAALHSDDRRFGYCH